MSQTSPDKKFTEKIKFEKTAKKDYCHNILEYYIAKREKLNILSYICYRSYILLHKLHIFLLDKCNDNIPPAANWYDFLRQTAYQLVRKFNKKSQNVSIRAWVKQDQ